MNTQNSTTARWIAIAAFIVLISACGACVLLVAVFAAGYGGQTVRIRNPFAAPTAVVAVNAPNPSNGNQTNGGTTINGNGSTTTNPSAPLNSNPSSTTATDFLPSLSGYTTTSATSLNDALTGILGAQSAQQGQTLSAQSLEGIVTTVLVSKVDDVLNCARQSGAADVRVYVQADLASLLSGNIPPLGIVGVINQDQLGDAIVACTVSSATGGVGAQSVSEPCGNFGQFRARGATFAYVYAGTSPDFCARVATHFSAFEG
jgi:hypothetical protein